MQPTGRRFLFTLVILALLAGCAGPTFGPRTPAYEGDPGYGEARRLEAAGDFAAAGDLLERLSAGYEPPDRERLLLRAARDFLQAGDIWRSEALLTRVDARDWPELQLDRRLLEAEIALAGKRVEEALVLLEKPPGPDASQAEVMRYLALRGETLHRSGKTLEGAFALIELDLLTIDIGERLPLQVKILDRLTTLGDTALELLQPDPPGIQGGWMELARVVRSYAGDPEVLPGMLIAWRDRFPSHPALPELVAAYREELRGRFRRPDRVAVLLPASGPYAKPAAALEAGFLAAYYQEVPADRPVLSFYDNGDPADTWPLFHQAVEEGADMVVGPLDKEGVAQLLRAGELEVPVLALNQVPPESASPPNLFQFGLSPEDEARQVAERGWLDGHTRALALVPEGPWGGRILEAFRDRWERLGGTLVEVQRYAEAENDFSAPIRALLDIDESEQRRRALQGQLGRQLEFEPRRRQDAGFVFLIAKSQIGRQIRPQLQFHHAAGLPVYATSHVFTGASDPKGDRDLEGVRFPDIPWLLVPEPDDPLSPEQLAGIIPESGGSFRRLYAMGIDSYGLIAHLPRLISSPEEVMNGRTGILTLDEVNQLRRRLVWAEMHDGLPRVLGYAEPVDDLARPPLEDRPAPVDEGAGFNVTPPGAEAGEKP